MNQQIKRWFQSHSHGAWIHSCLSFVKKFSLKQVACHEYKSDIAKIATWLSGAEAGKQGYIKVFQAAVESKKTLDDFSLWFKGHRCMGRTHPPFHLWCESWKITHKKSTICNESWEFGASRRASTHLATSSFIPSPTALLMWLTWWRVCYLLWGEMHKCKQT
jgi:hypothetical protein